MVIDIHTHTFPDKLAATTIPKLEGMSHTRAYVDGTVSGLRASMAGRGWTPPWCCRWPPTPARWSM